jgi:hypothetical protein
LLMGRADAADVLMVVARVARRATARCPRRGRVVQGRSRNSAALVATRAVCGWSNGWKLGETMIPLGLVIVPRQGIRGVGDML